MIFEKSILFSEIFDNINVTKQNEEKCYEEMLYDNFKIDRSFKLFLTSFPLPMEFSINKENDLLLDNDILIDNKNIYFINNDTLVSIENPIKKSQLFSVRICSPIKISSAKESVSIFEKICNPDDFEIKFNKQVKNLINIYNYYKNEESVQLSLSNFDSVKMNNIRSLSSDAISISKIFKNSDNLMNYWKNNKPIIIKNLNIYNKNKLKLNYNTINKNYSLIDDKNTNVIFNESKNITFVFDKEFNLSVLEIDRDNLNIISIPNIEKDLLYQKLYLDFTI